MARKAKTHAKLKKELDAVFSKYIRYYYADSNAIVECYTCGVQKPVKEMQNGHLQSRKHMSTRYHENNCRVQCQRCNIWSEGEKIKFYRRLCSEIGEEAIEEIIQLSHKSVKYSKGDLEYLIDLYKQKLKDLDNS
tara:strand:- start:66 stop:470 length:405 start_codon:yes stop_codon:yes gene_type:complete